MPPTPSNVLPGDEIVISGIAGRFPESDNVEQLRHNLLNKVDMVTQNDRRWKLDHPVISKASGKVRNLDKFDASFFPLPTPVTNWTDPMCRLALEHSWEAIMDAGVNPQQLRGKRIAVIVALSVAEMEHGSFACGPVGSHRGKGIVFSRAHFANFISYCLGFTGPSYVLDTGCSSSGTAIECALRAIRGGLCDAAIVGGTHLCLLPHIVAQLIVMGVAPTNSRCNSFDEAADGFVRSESVCTVFLQKAKDAKRIYATLVNARTNSDGFKQEGVFCPSTEMQSAVARECYEECKLSPACVNFVEAHGTGTLVGDPVEIASLDEVFCKNIERSEPLLVGAVKSNLGHCEAASGLVSMIKVLLSMNSRVIFPNLHFNQARKECTALVEGRIKVVTEPTPWNGGYVGLNSYGFGGSNAHIILKSYDKPKINKAPEGLPRLVLISGRTLQAVQTFFDDLKKKTFDAEYVGLLHEIFSHDINRYLYRGYMLMDQDKSSDNYPQVIQPSDGGKRPVWFVFSGMGSQWSGMGKDLLRLPVFAETVRKCDAVLRPHGLDIYRILGDKDETIFESILCSFVGITVIQIGLVDVLYALNIKPDYVVGHSMGECGCAYAYGHLSLEQTVLSSYYRGLVSIEEKLIHGSMAAVGLGYKELRKICPQDIVIACHNSASSSTISGPATSVEAFVRELETKKIFVKKVESSGIAYHSHYIKALYPRLLALMKELIPNPVPRGETWISTSVPKDEWNSSSAQLCSAEYLTNNLCNTVLFEEILDMIQTDAITIEIAPHGLLQAILRRALPSSVSNCTLTLRDHENSLNFFLESIGKLYNLGMQPDIAKIYPKIEFPVSCGTQSISPLIKWEHSDQWFVYGYESHGKNSAGEHFIIVELSDYAYAPMIGHVVDGLNLFPATGYIKLVWEAFSLMHDKYFLNFPVLFKDVQFSRATIIPEEGEIIFRININIGSGRFEVTEGQTAVASGFVYDSSYPEARKSNIVFEDDTEEDVKTDDIYTRLKIVGCDYSGPFCSIVSSNITGTKGHIKWQQNWEAFLDNMLQMSSLSVDSREICVPIGIDRIFIDPEYHTKALESSGQNGDLPVHVDRLEQIIISGGAEIRGLRVASINRRKQKTMPIIHEYKFVPYEYEGELQTADILRIVCQIVCENHRGSRVKIAELTQESDEATTPDLMSHTISEAFNDIPAVHSDITIITTREKKEDDTTLSSFHLISPTEMGTLSDVSIAVGYGLLKENRDNDLEHLISKLQPQGFLLTRENGVTEDLETLLDTKNLDLIFINQSGEETFVLLRKRAESKLGEGISIIPVTNDKFDWIEQMRGIMEKNTKEDNTEPSIILFVGQDGIDNGLMGLIKCLKQELGGEMIRGVLIQDPTAKKFSLDIPVYAKHLAKDLSLNVLRADGTWGTYVHLPVSKPTPKPCKHVVMEQLVPRDLSSLTWVEGPISGDSNILQSKNLFRVACVGMNFRDIMLASGRLGTGARMMRTGDALTMLKPHLGIEFSGCNSSGERVMGFAISASGFTNLYECDPRLTFKVPDSWTFEDAATALVAYSTAYCALFHRGRMEKGDKVLIHSGSGAVGQAAIRLALHEHCEVFTTVGTPEKREFIKNLFPQIKDDHIGNSRDTSFRRMVMEHTNGLGVDIVLNSLVEEKLQASVECLTQGGRFLEIGKYDSEKNNQLGMKVFTKDVSFHGVMLDCLLFQSREKCEILAKYIMEGLQSGAVQPIVRTVFARDDIEAAFRYMTSGKHIGKVVVKIHDENQGPDSPIKALPRYYCMEERSYIVLGGLGGFGLELVDWLISRGARNVVISSRSGVKSGYQKMKVRKWKNQNIRVIIISEKDASRHEDCKFILEAANQLAPVDGIFNLAAVLKDGSWENQTAENFEEVFRCKAIATRNLDALSREMCAHLRTFVVFSSGACGRGNPGQANYGMANAVMERICELRASEGLPAQAIQWGAIADVGAFSRLPLTERRRIRAFGCSSQSITSCLEELGNMLIQDRTVLSCMVFAEKESDPNASLSIIEHVMKIIGLKNLDGINPNTPLAELGLDSMMAVEIKQTLERVHGVFLNPQDLRTLNFKKLQEMSAKGSSQGNLLGSATDSNKDSFLLNMKDLLFGSNTTDADVSYELQKMNASTGKEIFLIPGGTGFTSIFQAFAQKLNTSVTSVQLGFETAEISVQDMADRFLQDIYNRCKSDMKFVLVGHSLGSMVAIELARKLEQMGLRGLLFFIEGAPEYCKCIAKIAVSDEDQPKESLQNNILLSRRVITNPKDYVKLSKALKESKDWEDKLRAYFDIFPNPEHGVSIEFQRGLFQSMYVRFSAILEYNIRSEPKIESPITLFKATAPIVTMEAHDYGLSEVTKSEIRVIDVNGEHFTVMEDPKVADVINEMARDYL